MSAADVSRKYAVVGLGLIVGPNASYQPGRTARTLEAEATMRVEH